MSTQHDIIDVLHDAKETERDVRVMDVDVPFELSAVRVLCRSAEGDDPQVPFDNVAYSFKNIRTERSKLIFEACSRDSRVRSYELVAFNPATKQQETIFSVENGIARRVLSKTDADLVMRSVSSVENTQLEIDTIRDTVITDDYIDYFISSYFDEGDEKSMNYARSTRSVL